MPRWLKIAGIGCGGLFVLFVVFFVGVMVGTAGSGDSPASGSDDSQSAPSLQEQQGDNEQTPEASPDLATTAEEEQEALTLSGTGSQVTEPIELSEGLALFEVVYQGEGYYSVWLLDEEGEEIDLIANGVDSAEASQGIRIPQSGTYRLNVESEGSWTIQVQ